MTKPVGLDYEKLVGLLKTKKTAKLENKIAADTVRSHMKKVAFDVYNLDNDPYDGLWKLESSADDGKEYLVRMDNDVAETKTGGWTALSNENGTSITLAYKNVPIQRLSGKIFGFNKDDVGIFKKALVEKVAQDDNFKNMILGMLSNDSIKELVKAFPELANRNKR